ncbi:iron-containing alcohol dehydrogenase [Sporolactobacillus shoreicorticis]|uniref:1-propanol dehydrogenase PduQ n=1 Tax=Sporolactobacillus shoreicorticis TaxID=1923877 RepID=A0ABW5S605_9BACL|nr:1-propanol dehydrogenase PduQ [Sporolactobacillus shoreicorticis]MCO7124442.1 iron-containing alcohol dehydrogenase [Sporolactobacillus shoreicorticis]
MGMFFLRTKILINDAVNQEIDHIHAERVWIGCDPFLVTNERVKEIIGNLERKNEVSVFSDIVPEPPLEKIASGIASVVGYKPTIILAIGGGSAIDTAKAVRFFAQKKFPLHIKTFYAMPTTSGTGSEVTGVAVVTDVQNKTKYPLTDDAIVPDVALLLPELVAGCPKSVTAFSGMDVLTHALEALVATQANAFSDALAEKAASLVFEYLPKCYEDGTNLASRSIMHEASCLAGVAFQNAGLGVSHAIAHQIGGQFHLPHGLVNSILLPHVVHYNATDSAAKSKYAVAARKLGIAAWNDDDAAAVRLLIQKIVSLSVKLNCSQSLTESGVSKEAIASGLGEIIENAQKDFTYQYNPIVPTKKDLVDLLLASV